MAERKSVNKYYPPDWDPSKGSVNKYVGQHPLRDRAKKLSQGILVIRFEMPYNIWCGGCNSHIGMGVRYNAEKTKTGMYYTTPIYKFRMKCHLCPNYFEIQTDPKNHDYVILEGARRKEQRWDPKENEQIVPEDRATHKKMATDAMFKLEHGSDDVKKGKAVVMTLSNLEGRRDSWKDDYILNKIARQKFREEKKTLKSAADSDAALLSKSSLEIPLVEEREQDKKLAHLMKYRTVQSFDEKQAQKRKEIESTPLFRPSKIQKLDSSPSDSKKLGIIKKHLQNIGNKKTCPFNSNRLNSHSKSSFDKVSLGIKRKSPGTASSGPAEEVIVETDTSVDMREVDTDSSREDTGSDSVTHTVLEDHQTETQDEIADKHLSHSEDDRSSVNEPVEQDMVVTLEKVVAQTDRIEGNDSDSKKDITPSETVKSDICHSESIVNDVKNYSNSKDPGTDEMNNDRNKLENIAHHIQDLKHEIANDNKCYSGDTKHINGDGFSSVTNFPLSKEKLDSITSDIVEKIEGKDFVSTHTCDSKDNSVTTKSENCEEVCDVKFKNQLETEVLYTGTETDTGREMKVSADTNNDRKSLSLVANYSDSDNDSS